MKEGKRRNEAKIETKTESKRMRTKERKKEAGLRKIGKKNVFLSFRSPLLCVTSRLLFFFFLWHEKKKRFPDAIASLASKISDSLNQGVY